MGLFRKKTDSIVKEHFAERLNLPPLGTTTEWQKWKWRDTLPDQLITERYLPNSVVSSCVSTYLFSYPEPSFKVSLNESEYNDKALIRLLNEPHPDLTQSDLARYKINDVLLTGNSYLYKIYNAFDEVIQLLPFNDCNINPVGTATEFIAYYNFFPREGGPIRVEKKDIIHWAWPGAIDPYSRNKGLSPLLLVVREIDSDVEATQYVMDYLSNHAMPGLFFKMLNPESAQNAVMSVDKNGKIEKGAAEKIVTSIREKFGGKGRGSTMIAQPGWDASILTPPLKDLEVGELGSRQEARICAVLRVPPEVAGVNVGMAHSTENNLAAAEVRFTNRTLIPLWVQDADRLTKGLRANFGNQPFKIEYNTEAVASVREQKKQDNLVVVSLFEKGIITKDEAREGIGLPELEEEVKPNELRETVGGVTGWVAIVESYSRGDMPRETAVQTAVEFYGFAEDVAGKFFPEGVKPKEPEEKPETIPAEITE